MQPGWVKIHRALMSGPGYFSEPFCRNMAWVDMILLANHEPTFFRVRGVKVEVNRGQIGYGSENLARRWQWSRGKVLRFLKELELDEQIVQQKNNVTTLISIVNYDRYQDNETANSTASSTTNGQQAVQQTDSRRTRLKNDKNDKNDKNGKNEKNLKPAEPPASADEPDLIYKNLVDTWFSFYKKNYSAEPTFKSIDGKAINTIKAIAAKRSQAANIELTPESAGQWFDKFLLAAYSIEWLRMNFTLPAISAKIDIILNKPKEDAKQRINASQSRLEAVQQLV